MSSTAALGLNKLNKASLATHEAKPARGGGAVRIQIASQETKQRAEAGGNTASATKQNDMSWHEP